MAALAADRIAFNWGNSNKDLVTGAYDIHQNDGLYYRVNNDSLTQSSSVLIPNLISSTAMSGPSRKLQKAATHFPKGLTGILTYRNRLIERKVEVQLSRMITPLPFLVQWFGKSKALTVSSSSGVTEPVEFIRNTELMITYLPLIKQSMTDKAAADAIHDTLPEVNLDLLISSEAEASSYIRELVHGHSVVIETDVTGESRKIDALDPDGIAHEAKYTVNNQQAHQEILKDVELIQKGLIKGAVWHFFKIQKTGQNGLTPALRKDLEDHGIIVVVHS
ncbi:hypothetical protein EHS13_18205 [Paenibacillus psychroresistens]|uniref:Uncharacterized protein n=2 Tax=Paenibacillus psychroresistens TaxID=1778678 RepID=A0A6B8RLZ0_9BACL|nr:hypothetical protein EHS13_18205 [Paenibacillus psychroresistens]